MRLSIRFAWYDLWIGAFWDRHSCVLYVCILPTIPIRLEFLYRRGTRRRILRRT